MLIYVFVIRGTLSFESSRYFCVSKDTVVSNLYHTISNKFHQIVVFALLAVVAARPGFLASPYGAAAYAPAAYASPLAYHAPAAYAAPLAYHTPVAYSAPIVKAAVPVATSYANTYKVSNLSSS